MQRKAEAVWVMRGASGFFAQRRAQNDTFDFGVGVLCLEVWAGAVAAARRFPTHPAMMLRDVWGTRFAWLYVESGGDVSCRSQVSKARPGAPAFVADFKAEAMASKLVGLLWG